MPPGQSSSDYRLLLRYNLGYSESVTSDSAAAAATVSVIGKLNQHRLSDNVDPFTPSPGWTNPSSVIRHGGRGRGRCRRPNANSEDDPLKLACMTPCTGGSPKDQRRYFHTSRASAYEVAAILDVAEGFGVLGKGYHTEGKDICDHLAAMLSNFR